VACVLWMRLYEMIESSIYIVSVISKANVK